MADALKPGDEVAFLNSQGGGKVIAIQDDENLMIELHEGFEVQVNRNEVVKQRDFTGSGITHKASSSADQPEAETPQSSEPYGTYLAFDKRKSQEVLDLYMINHTHFTLYFQIFEQPNNQPYRGISQQQLAPFTYQMVNRYHTSEFDAWPAIIIQGLYFTDKTESLPDPFVYTFKPKAKAFFKAVRTAPVLNAQAHLFQIDQSVPEITRQDLMEASEPSLPETGHEGSDNWEPEGVIDRPPEVMDLHIDRLVPDHDKMERDAILDYQLNYFEHNLEKAIAHRYTRVIFIHGVGNGVLRERLHQKLKQKPEVRSYREADPNQYGYGATEVRFYKEP